MYTEEHLDDAYLNEDMDDISIDTSTVDSEIIEIEKIKELNRRNDPDYYCFKRYEETIDGTLKLEKVRIYTSPLNGYIRNAITGIFEDYRVGSTSEDLFFSVKDTVYKVDKNQRKLFYRNPEQFERHFKIELSHSIKEKWIEKFLRFKYKQ